MKKFFSRLFLWYLRLAARLQLAKVRPRVIALAGSVRKTSPRNALGAVLKDRFRIKVSEKANSETGLPLDILGLHPQTYSVGDWLRLSLLIPIKLLTNWEKYDFYIAELGVDDPFPPKNMSYLLTFIKPEIAIFLSVAPVHTQQFEKLVGRKKFRSPAEKNSFLLKAIAREKGRLVVSLPKDKKALINIDDKLVLAEGKKSRAQLYFFGRSAGNKNQTARLKPTCFLKTTSYQLFSRGTSFGYQYQRQKAQLKVNYLLPEYYGSTFGAALLTGLILGFSLKEAVSSLAGNFSLPPGRMSLFKGIKGTILIDSSYNASRRSVLGALEMLNRLGQRTGRNRIFVFGDMRELGNEAKREHRLVAKEIIFSADRLVLIGPLTKKWIWPLVKDKLQAQWFPNSFQAADWLKNHLAGREIILVKGSQNTIFTEIVTEALLADKNEAIKLCRRGKFWHKQRQRYVRAENE